jgi:2-dehydropantoate 2-reductase
VWCFAGADKKEQMRIAVIGAGGAGGYFGGLLARAGEDVTFIARGATLAALGERGLCLKSRQLGMLQIPVLATDDPAAVGPVELILFCVKTYQTAGALDLLPPLIGPDTLLLSAQNGLGNEEAIGAAIGAEHVLGCVAGVSAVPEEPGVIRIDFEPGGLHVGELRGGTSDRTASVVATLQGAPFMTAARDDMPVQLWNKLMAIAAFSGVCALTRQPVGVIREHAATRAAYLATMAEVFAVARARDIALRQHHLDDLTAMFDRHLSPRSYGSMYHDLAAGRPLELEAINGAVVRLGREAGVPTPWNRAIYAALQPYLNGAPVLP